MKIICSADWHICWDTPVGRTDVVRDTIRRKLRFIFEHAIGVPILVAGDVTDKPRSWDILTLALNILSEKGAAKVYTVFGQHDTVMYNEATRESTVLGVLASTGMVFQLVPQHPAVIAPRVYVYGCS